VESHYRVQPLSNFDESDKRTSLLNLVFGTRYWTAAVVQLVEQSTNDLKFAGLKHSISFMVKANEGRHDTQHDDIQHNDMHHNNN
jgi:hypothetical protein